MASFSVETIGTDPRDMQSRFQSMGGAAPGVANRALRQTGEKVKADLEDTSPVDSGEYRDSWYMLEVAEDEVWILNEADHARFVMLPNSKMVGSASADLPSAGVLHNVEGVARNHQTGLQSNVSRQIMDLLRRLRPR